MAGKDEGHRPVRDGALVALLAALLFGVTAPLIKIAGSSLGPFSTAALLYLGAALMSAPSLRRRSSERDAPVRRRDTTRLLGVALFGAVLAPAALAWGLQRSTATTASLLLNSEAFFTVVLARIAFAEHIGRRVALALTLIGLGGALLVLRPGGAAVEVSWGALAVVVASLGWALDNTIGRALAERDPSQVVFWKGALGAVAATLIALLLREPLPPVRAGLLLVLLGTTGYGLSLRLYLVAQRRLGAARTGSVFATAPFIGALVAVALGEPWSGAMAWVAAVLFVGGIYLHLSERHRHPHVHEVLEHEHIHRHDDGHHDHRHDPPVAGAHSHSHRHERVEHDHEHAPDLHHRH